MKRFFCYAMVFTMGMAGCTDGPTARNTQKISNRKLFKSDKEFPAKLCYVLCDFSKSQDSVSKLTISRNADTIFSAGMLKCQMKYYDISAELLEDPFFEFSKLIKGSMKPSEKDRLIAEALEQKDTLKNRIRRDCVSKSAQNTCIIKALDAVASSLVRDAEKDKDQKILIVILSDMLEDCIYGAESVEIDIDNSSNYKTAAKALEKLEPPRNTFGQYKNLTITIIGSSQRNLDNNRLHAFWDKALARHEYSSPAIISPSLPVWAR